MVRDWLVQVCLIRVGTEFCRMVHLQEQGFCSLFSLWNINCMNLWSHY